MPDDRPFLSLVIPAYNEAARLPGTLPAALEFVEAQPYAAEVIVVDNNSVDATREIAEQAARSHPVLRVISEPQRGKGAAVRAGALAARGEYIFFADADFSMPVAEIANFLPPVRRDFDVAIGSREAPGAVRYDEPQMRHLMGRAFNWLVRLLVLRGLQDTQCGFKCFHRPAAEAIFRRQRMTDWTFDVELLFIARRLGCRIVEVPIHWRYQEHSRIHPWRDAARMAWGLLRLRWNGWRGVYGRPAGGPPSTVYE